MNLRYSFGQFPVLVAIILTIALARVAHAAVPTDTPVFANSTNITSPYSPFQSGGVKVYQGNTSRKKAVVVQLHLTETRDFQWNSDVVTCNILREMKFENGLLAELTDHYLAQADNESLYSFGKTVYHFTNGMVANNVGSWLVGDLASFDPSATSSGNEPTLVMLSSPDVGDNFSPKDPSHGSNVVVQVVRTNSSIGSGLGRFTNVVRMVERVGKTSTTLTFARDTGLITKKNKKESLRLIASTLAGPDLIVLTNNLGTTNNFSETDTNSNVSRPVPVRPIMTPTFPVTPTNPPSVTPGFPTIPEPTNSIGPVTPTNAVVNPTNSVTPVAPTNGISPPLPPFPN